MLFSRRLGQWMRSFIDGGVVLDHLHQIRDRLENPSQRWWLGTFLLHPKRRGYPDRISIDPSIDPDLCVEHNIIVWKPPASTWPITQPADADKVFISSKTTKRNMKCTGEVLEKTISDRLKVMRTLQKTRVGAKLPCHHVKSSVEGRTTMCSVHFTNYTKEGHYFRVIQDYRTAWPSNWRLQRRPYPRAVQGAFHYLCYRTSQESIAPTMRSDKKKRRAERGGFRGTRLRPGVPIPQKQRQPGAQPPKISFSSPTQPSLQVKTPNAFLRSPQPIYNKKIRWKIRKLPLQDLPQG